MAKEICITGVIGGFDWETFTYINTDSWFKKQLDAALADEKETVTVRINSPGGRVDHGTAIANRIAENSDRVNTLIDGVAYSMGAIIALQGGKVMMADNTTLLLHNASGSAWGNARDLRAAVEMLEANDSALATTIANKTGLTVDAVKKKWLDFTDHTFTAQQAQEAGIVDEVVNMKTAKMPKNHASMSVDELFAWYGHSLDNNRGAFEMVKAFIKKGFSSSKPVSTPIENSNSDEVMKIKVSKEMTAVVAILGVSFAEGETEKETEVTAENFNAVMDALNTATTAKAAETKALADEKAAHEATKNELATVKENTEAKGSGTPGGDGNDVVIAGTKEKQKVVSETTQRAIDLKDKRNKK